MSWLNSKVAQIIGTVLRLYLGWDWLTHGFAKVFGESAPKWVGENAGTAITGFLNGAISKSQGENPVVSQWFSNFVESIVLPNAKLFSYVVAWGELLVGLGLILGLFTTVAILAAMIMNVSYLLAGTISTNPTLLFLEGILLGLGAAAYYWGLDRLFLPRWKKWRLKKG